MFASETFRAANRLIRLRLYHNSLREVNQGKPKGQDLPKTKKKSEQTNLRSMPASAL